jgi:hypothetical protein
MAKKIYIYSRMCCVEEQSELEMVAKANKNMVKKKASGE